MKIIVVGLGRMGMQIVRKCGEDGHQVIAYDRNRESVDEAAGYKAIAAHEKHNAVEQFENEQVVLWLMIPSDVVEAELADWLKIVPEGSIIIDGGNSDFRLTAKRAKTVKAAGSALIDVGTSGGVWGYERGFCMMAGGKAEAFNVVEPLLKTLAEPNGAYHHFGESGSGHYVKMVHNAIEYGMMQSLAEGYRILQEGPYKGLDLGAAGETWQHGSVIVSWLNELCAKALQENPELKDIDGYVTENGEARWTLEVAKEMGIPMPSIQASFDVRLASQKGDINFATKLLAAMRAKFGGHNINGDK